MRLLLVIALLALTGCKFGPSEAPLPPAVATPVSKVTSCPSGRRRVKPSAPSLTSMARSSGFDWMAPRAYASTSFRSLAFGAMISATARWPGAMLDRSRTSMPHTSRRATST